MAKIKKKEFKERLEYEIRIVQRGKNDWKNRFDNDSDMKDYKATQMAYLDGMLFAYEHLMHYYGMKAD